MYVNPVFVPTRHLAHDMEEDEEESKFEIYPWALGRNWQCKLVVFIQCRDRLLQRMNYETLVSKQCCEQVGLLHQESINQILVVHIVTYHISWGIFNSCVARES